MPLSWPAWKEDNAQTSKYREPPCRVPSVRSPDLPLQCCRGSTPGGAGVGIIPCASRRARPKIPAHPRPSHERREDHGSRNGERPNAGSCGAQQASGPDRVPASLQSPCRLIASLSAPTRPYPMRQVRINADANGNGVRGEHPRARDRVRAKPRAGSGRHRPGQSDNARIHAAALR